MLKRSTTKTVEVFSHWRYRDTKTGRLVSEDKWRRSKSRGGERYKREKVTKSVPLAPPPRQPHTTEEWEDAYDEAISYIEDFGLDEEDYFDEEEEYEGGADYSENS